MPTQTLNYETIDNFSPGIVSNSRRVTQGSAVPAPKGAAQLNGTFGCIALPNGGLGPLPKVTNQYSVPLPDTDLNAALGYFQVNGFTTFGPVGPGPDGEVDDFFIGIEYLVAGGADRTFTFYRIDPVSGADPFPADTLLQVISAQNPTSEAYQGLSFAISRMNPTAPYLTPGTPVVVTSWAPPGFAADKHVIAFPEPDSPNTTGVRELASGRGLVNVGDVLGHQGRIVLLEYGTNPFGGRLGDDIPTNEQVSFSDPANSYNGTTTIGTQQSVYVQEYPNGYGAWGSVSAGELFLVKHQGGAVRILGDLNTPVVTRLPGVVSTGGFGSRAAACPSGLVYYSRFNGAYIWRGADTSEKISENLADDFIYYSPGNDVLLDINCQFEAWGDWVVASNGYLYDTNNQSWWRLDDPSSFVPQWFSRGFFGDNLFAVPVRLNNTTKTGAIRQYNMRVAASSFSWTGHPLAVSMDRVIDVRELVLLCQGAGTVVVTLTALDGTTQSETFNVTNSTQPQRLRLPTEIRGYNIVAKIVSTATSTGPAPIVYSLGFGYRDQVKAVTT